MIKILFIISMIKYFNLTIWKPSNDDISFIMKFFCFFSITWPNFLVAVGHLSSCFQKLRTPTVVGEWFWFPPLKTPSISTLEVRSVFLFLSFVQREVNVASSNSLWKEPRVKEMGRLSSQQRAENHILLSEMRLSSYQAAIKHLMPMRKITEVIWKVININGMTNGSKAVSVINQ